MNLREGEGWEMVLELWSPVPFVGTHFSERVLTGDAAQETSGELYSE